jgi:hypothetical protein
VIVAGARYNGLVASIATSTDDSFLAAAKV